MNFCMENIRIKSESIMCSPQYGIEMENQRDSNNNNCHYDEIQIDDEKLIKTVHRFPSLYVKPCRTFKDRQMANKMWMKIGQELELPVEELRKRWNSLRGQFAAHVKSVKAYKAKNWNDAETEKRSGAGAGTGASTVPVPGIGPVQAGLREPTFGHSKILSFLKPYVIPKPKQQQNASSKLTLNKKRISARATSATTCTIQTSAIVPPVKESATTRTRSPFKMTKMNNYHRVSLPVAPPPPPASSRCRSTSICNSSNENYENDEVGLYAASLAQKFRRIHDQHPKKFSKLQVRIQMEIMLTEEDLLDEMEELEQKEIDNMMDHSDCPTFYMSDHDDTCQDLLEDF